MTDNLLTNDTDISAENAGVHMSSPAIPEKFWDKNKQEIRADALLASYLELEKKLSKMVNIPTCDADKKRIQKLLGMPDAPEDYQISVAQDYIDIDPELNARLHAKGFTTEQVQEVYDLATEKMVPLILELAAEFQADRERERLIMQFGGPEKWSEISRQLQDYGQKNLPQAAFNGITCSYDGVMALYQMMKNDKGGVTVRGDSGSPEILDEAGIKALMQNPKYWRDRDPQFIAKVTAGFEKLYGGH